MKRIIILVCTAASLALISCGPSFQVKKPEGFAQYPVKNDVYRAIAPDGVRIKLRVEKNKPYGSAAMWNEAANLHLHSRGYAKLKEKKIESANGFKGYYTEYIYQYLGKNYLYCITVFASKKKIYVIEAAGIRPYFKKKGDLIEKWIQEHVVLK